MFTNALPLAWLLMALIIPSGQPGPLKPGEFVLAKPSRVVSWQLKRLAPPAALYVTPDDLLVASVASSQASEVVTVNYRLLRAMDGVVVAGQFTVTPASNRVAVVQTQHLTEGFLLSCSCQAKAATTRGQTFVRLFLGSGAYGAGSPSYMLMADYVTTAMAPAHPNGRQLSPVEGPGWLQSVAGQNFANTLLWRAFVPTNARWKVTSALSTVHTDATPGNRSLFISITDAGGAVWSATANEVIPAGSDWQYSIAGIFFPAQAAAPFEIASVIPPELLLLAGSEIEATGSFVGATDSFGVPLLHVEEWLDNV